MALNQTEERLYDYVRKNPEERHFWEHKIRTVAAAHTDDLAAAAEIDMLLRAYAVERVQVVKQLSDMPAGMSMRGLAEYLIRVWTIPRPKKKKTGHESY
jgi:hypothetical protein